MRYHRFPLSKRHLFIGALIFATLTVDAFVAYYSIQKLVRNERIIAKSFKVMGALENIESLTKDIEAGQRSYILTGDKRYLDTYNKAIYELPTSLNDLRSDVDLFEETQQSSAFSLNRAIKAKLELSNKGIELRQKSGLNAARKFVQTSSGKTQLDEISRLIDLMYTRENDRLESRALESSESANDATRTFWIATLANIAFLGLISVLLWRTGVQNEQLGVAYTNLKRAEEMRDSLTAMLVHDLRTPLTSLIGPLEMLESDMLGPLEDSQQEVVKMSRQSGQRLLGLVNQLMDVAKMEAGEFRIDQQIVETKPLLLRAVETVRGLELDGGARMEVETVQIEKIKGDPGVLERVLINLLGNAQKFTPEKGLIKVGVIHQDGPVFYVQDNGCGIPDQYKDKIFEKFGQVESRQDNKKFSTGLGLTFCRLAVEAHGGKIWVESEEGNGSKFLFKI